MDSKQDDKNKLKLVKCPNCERTFYLKVISKENLKIKCPYCEEEVLVKINEAEKDGSSQPPKA